MFGINVYTFEVMKKTILQKAKEYKAQKRDNFVPTKEMEEVALAWVKGDITLTQIAKALGLNNTGYRTYSILALTLKNYLNTKPTKK